MPAYLAVLIDQNGHFVDIIQKPSKVDLTRAVLMSFTRRIDKSQNAFLKKDLEAAEKAPNPKAIQRAAQRKSWVCQFKNTL